MDGAEVNQLNFAQQFCDAINCSAPIVVVNTFMTINHQPHAGRTESFDYLLRPFDSQPQFLSEIPKLQSLPRVSTHIRAGASRFAPLDPVWILPNMADIFSQAKRSAVMSLIRGRGNRDTELRLIALFREHAITGWRRNVPVFGRPDFVFPKQRVAVFVDGCFWHRHPDCKFAYTPKSRLDFWLPKFSQNVARDRLVNRTLRRLGWRVLRLWECRLATKYWPRTASRIRRAVERQGVTIGRQKGFPTQ